MRYELAKVLAGRPSGPSCEQLDREITLGMSSLRIPNHLQRGELTNTQATAGDSDEILDDHDDEEEALLRALG